MEKIVIIGGGGHARVLISIVKKLNRFDILGYVDTQDRGIIFDVNYLGDDAILQSIITQFPQCSAALGIGTVHTGEKRRSIYQRIKKIGFSFPSIVSPVAVVNSNTEIYEGVVIMDGAVINCGSIIGQGSIINTNSTIDHDCTIGEFVHIAPGSVLCGNVTVGFLTLIGAGATVIQGISIAGNCVIGAGSVIIENIDETGTFAGNPARRIQ